MLPVLGTNSSMLLNFLVVSSLYGFAIIMIPRRVKQESVSGCGGGSSGSAHELQF